MNLDMVILGSLARLPERFDEAELLRGLQAHGLTPEDARLAVTKAVLEGFISAAAGSRHTKLDRARVEPGRLAEP